MGLDISSLQGAAPSTPAAGFSVLYPLSADAKWYYKTAAGAVKTIATLEDAQVFTGDVTVGGNLTVNGTLTTINTTTLSVTDPLIKLAAGNAADVNDEGFYAVYKPAATTLYAGLFRDATDGKFKLFNALQEEPTTTVNTAGTGYAVATLVCNLDSPTITTPVINTAAHVGGSWVADATWTLPALTLGGNVSSTGNPSLNIGTGAITAGLSSFVRTYAGGLGEGTGLTLGVNLTGTPAANDGISLDFQLTNSTPAQISYGQVATVITTATAGVEASKMLLRVRSGGSFVSPLTLTPTALTLGSGITSISGGTNPSLNIGTGALTAGAGTFSLGQNAETTVTISNTTSGTGAAGRYVVTSSEGSAILAMLSDAYTTSGIYVTRGGVLVNNGRGGWSIAATDAAGVIRVYAQGTTEVARFTANGINGALGQDTPAAVAATTLSAMKVTAGDVITWTNGGATPGVGYLYSGSQVVALSYGAGVTQNALVMDGTSTRLLGPGQTATAAVTTSGLAVTGTLSATDVIKASNATGAAVADTVEFYSSDDAAGHTIPSFFTEGTNVLATGQADSASSVRVKMRINGTVVTLLAI